MKNILARLLAFCLLLSMLIPAASAEGMTLNQVEQNVFVSTSFIEKEAYPEVIFNASPTYKALDDIVYLRFPAPDGMPIKFSQDVSSFFMEDLFVQQSYQLMNSAAFETFLNNAASKSMIILNQPDAAAYLDTEYLGSAYGLIAVPELGKNAKLYISMTFHNYYSNTISDKEIEVMTNAMLSEIERIQSTIRFEQGGAYWTQDFYSDLNIRSLHANLSANFKINELPFLGKNSVIENVSPTLLSVDSTKVSFVAITSSGKPKIEFDINTYSYVNSKKKSDPDSVFTLVLDDGYEYDVYGNFYDNSRYISFQVSRLLTDKTKDNRDLYLTWSVSGDSEVKWYTKEDISLLLNALMDCVTINTDLELLNYKGVPAEAEEPQEEPAKSVKGGWGFFNNSNTNNSTGSDTDAKADPSAWTCECGSVNTSKFCPECGSQKPDYKCKGCDYVFEKDSAFKFCPECGTKR